MNSDQLLSIRSLEIALPKGAERTNAVEDLSYGVSHGEILCVVGESGSGKSITAQAIMGLLPKKLRKTAGQIVFQGTTLDELDGAAWQKIRGNRIGMIFQDPMSALNPLLPVGAQIDEVLRAHSSLDRNGRGNRVVELLAQVGLPDPAGLRHVYPFRLSGGQRQRVLIASALAMNPDLLIADEPTTALDVTTQKQIIELIKSIQRKHKMGVMFITHDFGVVAEIADRVAVMRSGRLVELGDAGQVLRFPTHAYTRQLINAVPKLSVIPPTNSLPDRDDALLQTRGLMKSYGRRIWSRGRKAFHALNNVSISVRKGQTVGIVGESGSGKSTFARCVVRLMEIDGGTISYDGAEVSKLSHKELRPFRRRVQMVFQDPYSSLNPMHKVGRIISDGPREHGMAHAQALDKALQLLKMVGLDPGAADRYPSEFSGGQRQRIAIARALALEPDLLIADEAVSALDVSVQAQVLELLKSIRERMHLSMLFITHDLRVAAQMCDVIVVMRAGEVVEMGSTSEIFETPSSEYTKALLDAIPGKERHTTPSDGGAGRGTNCRAKPIRSAVVDLRLTGEA